MVGSILTWRVYTIKLGRLKDLTVKGKKFNPNEVIAVPCGETECKHGKGWRTKAPEYTHYSEIQSCNWCGGTLPNKRYVCPDCGKCHAPVKKKAGSLPVHRKTTKKDIPKEKQAPKPKQRAFGGLTSANMW